MATYEYELAEPPSTERWRESWLQHAAGFILFEDVRRYAIDKIDSALSPDARAAAVKGVDDALYGLMMVLDGVSGVIRSRGLEVNLQVVAQLVRRAPSTQKEVVAAVDLFHGDGMCLGYHGWLAGDFGEDPIVVNRPPKEAG